MPLYDYHCTDCEQDFEQRKPIAEADEASCPHCGSAHTKRLLSRVAMHVHGGGSSTRFASEPTYGSTCSSGSCCGAGGVCGVD